MSIIHDALKKVQESAPAQPSVNNLKPKPTPKQPESVVHAAVSTGDSEPNRTVVFVLIGVLSSIVIAIFVIIYILAQETTRHVVIAPEQTVPPQLSLTNNPPSSDTTDPLADIHVQGVMNKGGKTVALINDNIYEEGQAIFGRTIVEISLNNITILDNGSRRIFKVDSTRK